LHHLDLPAAAREILRMLKPRGKAAFAEPLASAPLFWIARRLTPRYRSRDERPMTRADIETFARAFAQSEIREIFLLAPMAYLVRLFNERAFLWLHTRLARGDSILLTRAPALGRWAWYGLIHLIAPGETNWH
jgi:SAM-dependent methyltransferase